MANHKKTANLIERIETFDFAIMTRKPVILIVEDNPVDAKLIKELLTDIGKHFDFVWSECLTGALAELMQGKQLINAILLDLSLPDSQGIETFEKVHDSVSHIPIIILTSLDDEKTGMYAVQNGAQDYLIKGQVNGQLLVRSIRYAIERKQSENILQLYRNQLQEVVELRTREKESAQLRTELLLNAVGEGIYGIDLEGKITFINPAALQMIGLEAIDALGKDHNLVIHFFKADGSDYTAATNPVSLTTKDGFPRYITEDTLWRNDGITFPVEYVCTPIKEDKKVVGAVVVFNDITLRKLTEIELRQSEERYRMLADNLSDIIWTIDLRGKFIYISPSVQRQTGYAVDEALKLTIEQMFTPSSAYIIQKLLIEIPDKIQSGQRVAGNMELEQCRKDGSVFWAEVNYNLMFNSNGQMVGLLGVSRDVTERKQLIEELRDAKKVAESATKIKSEFLANMSHEIRTPMNAIIGFADLLYASVKNEKQRSQLESIHSSAKSLMGIINDILDLSKIEAGKFKMDYHPVNLKNLIKDIEVIFARRMKDKGLTLFVDFDFEIPGVLMLDEVRLRQVLFNLLGNAVKFTEKGYISVDIEIESKSNNKVDLSLSVEDTGIGIPEDQHEMIFEAFQQQEGQSTRKYGGTGLGLTITKRLVEMMGGTITLTSEVGRGSIFKILLKDIEISKDGIIKPNDDFFDPKSIVFNPASVLVCDDNDLNRKLIIDLLDGSPITIFEAADGAESIDLAIKHCPDLILMDLKMPIRDGNEAAREIKANEMTKNIPIVALSASAIIVLKEDEQIFFNDLITKPFKISDVIEVIKKYLPFTLKEELSENIGGPVIFDLDDKDIDKLPFIIQILDENFLSMYHEALRNQRIDQMEDFGNSLKNLGEQYHSDFLIGYGSKICNYTDTFEIDKLLQALKEFPLILSRMKSKVNKD